MLVRLLKKRGGVNKVKKTSGLDLTHAFTIDAIPPRQEEPRYNPRDFQVDYPLELQDILPQPLRRTCETPQSAIAKAVTGIIFEGYHEAYFDYIRDPNWHYQVQALYGNYWSPFWATCPFTKNPFKYYEYVNLSKVNQNLLNVVGSVEEINLIRAIADWVIQEHSQYALYMLPFIHDLPEMMRFQAALLTGDNLERYTGPN